MTHDSSNNPFSNMFDITSQDTENLIIKETYNKDNCFIYYGADIIGGFILVNKPTVKTILKISFFKSTADNKYIPRLEFRKEDNN